MPRDFAQATHRGTGSVESQDPGQGGALTPRRAAVLGHPIEHSLSPVLHNAAYRALGLTGWAYSALDIEPPALASLLADTLLAPGAEWAGFSLTMPLKTHVIPWLGQITAEGRAHAIVDQLAAVTGAVNTLVRAATPIAGVPALSAHNTDVAGIVAALAEPPLGQLSPHGAVADQPSGRPTSPRQGSTRQVSTKLASPKQALPSRPSPGQASPRLAVLGAGATAGSALAAAAELGASQVVVYARPSDSRAELRAVAARLGLTMDERDLRGAAAALPGFDIVISTMPAHAGDPLAAAVIANATPCRGALLDVVYDPRPTKLLRAWSGLGGSAIGGERMLLHQAAVQVALMTGQPAPLAAMDAALQAALG